MSGHGLLRAVRDVDLIRRTGRVAHYQGLVIEADGPDACVGELCELAVPGRMQSLSTEVVGLHGGKILLMPFGDGRGIRFGSEIEATGRHMEVPVGDRVLGRVLDAFGHPIDDGPALNAGRSEAVHRLPSNPMRRRPIGELLETGVRAIDTFLTLGRGQRVGIFAGSGVGKSTLLCMIARNVDADVVVIALIGERGREVQDFLGRVEDTHGRAKLVVVVATSDQPALLRTRAAHTALTIAESFRDEGKNVLIIMDSLTRFAMAQREIGIAIGEPPMARGYTPSVFDALPKLVERCGNTAGGGSLTAIMTVLVEGDDLNDPIADAARSILDGAIVLSRQMANHGIYPAIDLLRSNSRLFPNLVAAADRALVGQGVAALSLYDENRELIEIGAYKPGSNPALDHAIFLREGLMKFLTQDMHVGISRVVALGELGQLLQAQA